MNALKSLGILDFIDLTIISEKIILCYFFPSFLWMKNGKYQLKNQTLDNQMEWISKVPMQTFQTWKECRLLYEQVQ